MQLIEQASGKQLSGIIEKITESDFKLVKNDKNFQFDWNEEKGNDVYKIRLKNDDVILGLVSIIDIPEEFRIHLNLIESSLAQRGKNKIIANIPGCLIGFCCRIAFRNGYDGFVSLTPKTQLRAYYASHYGFLPIGTQMAVMGESANFIIQKILRQ